MPERNQCMKIFGWMVLAAPFIVLITALLTSVFMAIYRKLSDDFGISFWEGAETIFYAWTIVAFVIIMLKLIVSCSKDT